MLHPIKIKKILIPCVLLAILTLSAGYSRTISFSSKEQPGQAVLPLVSAYRITPNELFDLAYYPARITSEIESTLLSEMDGVITEVSAQLGQKVKKDQKL